MYIFLPPPIPNPAIIYKLAAMRLPRRPIDLLEHATCTILRRNDGSLVRLFHVRRPLEHLSGPIGRDGARDEGQDNYKDVKSAEWPEAFNEEANANTYTHRSRGNRGAACA